MSSPNKIALKYEYEISDYYHQQFDGTAYALDRKTGKRVSGVSFSLYRNVININYVETLPEYRKHGVATRLIVWLKQKHPGYTLNPGMVTDYGAYLFKSLFRKRKRRGDTSHISKKKNK
jgi:GNAT superfamily N-acetyltransferase